MKLCPVCTHENPVNAINCENCQSAFRQAGSSTKTNSKTTISHFDPLDLIEGDIIAERYRIIRQIGTGGMGAVFLVADMELNDEECALKMIHPRLVAHPEARERFKSEVTTSRQLLHDGIIRVFDLGRNDDLYYFTMEYLEGQSLAALLEERKGRVPPFSLDETRRIIVSLLNALSYAHKKTIHRDIKPDNVILTGKAPDTKIKILDFGIARTMSNSRFTQTAQGLGTPYYMAPEQLKDAHSIDHRADLYGVGMILYEMLTGTQAIGRFQLPSEIISPKYKPLDELIITALAPEPEQRYTDAQAMKAAFLQAIDKITETTSPEQYVNQQKADVQSSQPETVASGGSVPEKTATPVATGQKLRFSSTLIGAVLAVMLCVGGGIYFFLYSHDSKTHSGSLNIRVTPSNATITIENGPDYLPDMKLAPGKYDIQVSAPGYVTRTRTVEIFADQLTFENINLKPDSKTCPVRVKVDPPNASVEIVNGPEYYPGINLAPGNYEIRVSAEGYESQTWPIIITDKHDELNLQVSLEPATVGWLRIERSPRDATVRILNIRPKYYDGIPLSSGSYQIEVSKSGYVTRKFWIKVQAGELCTKTVTLQRKSQQAIEEPPPKPSGSPNYPVPPEIIQRFLPEEINKYFRK